MFSISQLNEIQIIVFALILLRMTGFIFSAAIFNSPSISIPVKVLLSVVLAMLLFNTVASKEILVRVSENQNSLLIFAVMEILIGVSIGFLTRIFFFTVSMAGELISISMGLGQAQMFNPLIGNMGNALEQFLVFLATLLYFALNGHHYLIHGLTQSFQIISLGKISLATEGYASSVYMAQQFFILGIKIAAPVLIAMMVVQVGVGLLSRAVPQINVLTTTSSVTAVLGFIVLFISLPLMVFQMTGIIDVTTLELFKFIKHI